MVNNIGGAGSRYIPENKGDYQPVQTQVDDSYLTDLQEEASQQTNQKGSSPFELFSSSETKKSKQSGEINISDPEKAAEIIVEEIETINNQIIDIDSQLNSIDEQLSSLEEKYVNLENEKQKITKDIQIAKLTVEAILKALAPMVEEQIAGINGDPSLSPEEKADMINTIKVEAKDTVKNALQEYSPKLKEANSRLKDIEDQMTEISSQMDSLYQQREEITNQRDDLIEKQQQLLKALEKLGNL